MVLRSVWPLKTTKRAETLLARLLKKVVAEAGALGELKRRGTQVEDQMKQIDIMDRKDRSVSLKRRAGQMTEPAPLVALPEHRRIVREHRTYLARMRFLLQEEWEQIGRLKSEMEIQLSETIDLLKRPGIVEI